MTDAQPHSIQPSFRGEIKDFVLSEIDDIGAFGVFSGLEAALQEEAGVIVGEGVTPDMIDGNAAIVVAEADMVAMFLGHPPAASDPDVVAALEGVAEDLREETGLANLAARALDVVTTSPRFRDARGECADVASFRALLAEVRERIALCERDHPGIWELPPADPGVFRVTMFPEAGSDDR